MSNKHRAQRADRNADGERSCFYHFNQNNSGGRFDYDADRGLTCHVLIEATGKADAVSRAENIGIYFDGCNSGVDCPCCGDRWSEPWDDGATYAPEVYGKPAHTAVVGRFPNLTDWVRDGRFNVVVHYMDGEIEWLCPGA